MPVGLGDEWGLAVSPYVQVTFDIAPVSHKYPYAILCENYDAGCRLGISISKVINGVKKQWWMEKRTMRGIRIANSLVDWLNEEIQDVKTHQWGWDRVVFFGPHKRVGAGESERRWQERVDAAEPGVRDLVASRARKDYDFAGANVVPIEFNHGTKRKFEDAEEEEKEEEDEDEEEEEEEKFGAARIWREQVVMTRKYLTANHRQMAAQGVTRPYFSTYRSFEG